MSLSSSRQTLTSDLNSAYLSSKSSGELDGANSDAIISKLAADISLAIHKFMTADQTVKTDVTVNVGQFDTIGGVTISPGLGSGKGKML